MPQPQQGAQADPARLAQVLEVTHITTKQELSRWTRAHADNPGIHWSVLAGPGGTMIIVEHARDRASLPLPAPVVAASAVVAAA
jgi:hypothetical protein